MSRIEETTLQQIEDELGEDGVWVSPQLRDEVPPDVEARIEAAVAEARTPTYVTLVELAYGDPLTNGDAAQLANVIRDDTGRTGVYIGLQPTHRADQPFLLDLTSFPADDPPVLLGPGRGGGAPGRPRRADPAGPRPARERRR